MINGGGSIHAQNVADAYISSNTNQASGGGVVMGQVHMGAKSMKKNIHNNNFNQSKYISGNVSTHHNNSVSPASQTFFKETTKK